MSAQINAKKKKELPNKNVSRAFGWFGLLIVSTTYLALDPSLRLW